jgi:hypothetical protein
MKKENFKSFLVSSNILECKHLMHNNSSTYLGHNGQILNSDHFPLVLSQRHKSSWRETNWVLVDL